MGIKVRGKVVVGIVVSGLLTEEVGVPEIIVPCSSKKAGGTIVPKRVGVWRVKGRVPGFVELVTWWLELPSPSPSALRV